MTAPDPLLDSLLDAVRLTKRRRQCRRATLAAAACILPALAFLMIPRGEEAPLPMVHLPGPSTPTPPVVTAAPAAPATLAVMVWQNGVPRLEELPTDELGLVELNFGLEPVFAYPDAYWRDPWL